PLVLRVLCSTLLLTPAMVFCFIPLCSRLLRNWLQGKSQRAPAPVSYTHLTLPTNEQQCRSRWAPDH
uniref:hypothetical protein n=1 Tax=Aquitalea sp. ASV15 TaxID=2795104 RepID=UPI0018EAE44D